jgi:hypothetical protein
MVLLSHETSHEKTEPSLYPVTVGAGPSVSVAAAPIMRCHVTVVFVVFVSGFSGSVFRFPGDSDALFSVLFALCLWHSLSHD